MKKNSIQTPSCNPKLTLIALALLNINAACASMPSQSPITTSYNTRATGQFLAGDHQQLGGFGDVMLPFMQTQNRIFFADGTILLGQNNRATYSGGLGYRGIQNTGFGRGILGAYAFAEYYQTDLKNKFWQVNPGLEWLTERYEARLQGYIPLSSRTQGYRNILASNIPQAVLFDSGRVNTLAGAKGHSIINTPVQLYEEFGPGVELEAGKHFDYGRGLWVRFGGYYFNYRNSDNISGVQANIEMAVNDYAAVILQNNYDDQNKNRFAIGLRVNFGGSDAPKHTLESRMTSPIIRHAARQSYGEALPSRQNFRANGATFNLADNIWFFSPNGTYPLGAATTLANCTAESPCLTLDSPTAAQIGSLTPNAQFYFETGTYLIPEGSPRVAHLQNGQSVWGRNTGWLTPAFGDARPLIQGSLVWGNNNGGVNPTIANGAFYNARLENSNQITPTSVYNFAQGGAVLGLAATGNLIVQESVIDVLSTTDNISAVGIASSTTTASNVDVNARSEGQGNIVSPDNGPFTIAGGYGINAEQDVYVYNSRVNAQSTGDAIGGGDASATGVSSTKSTATVVNSNVTTTASGNVTGASAAASTGIIASKGTSIVKGSTVFAKTTGNVVEGVNNKGSSNATGVFSATADVRDSIVTAETYGSVTVQGQAVAIGVEGGSVTVDGDFRPGTAVVSGSTIRVATNGNISGNSSGFVQAVRASTQITVTDSKIFADSNGSVTGNMVSAPFNDVVGVRSFGGALIENTEITVNTRGNVLTRGSSNAFGTNINGELTANNVIVKANTYGDTSGANAFAQAIGIRSSGSSFINNATVISQSYGSALAGGNVDVFGVIAANLVSSITFNGLPSFVTAISTNGSEFPTSGGVVNTNNSQCSTNGVNFIPCA